MDQLSGLRCSNVQLRQYFLHSEPCCPGPSTLKPTKHTSHVYNTTGEQKPSYDLTLTGRKEKLTAVFCQTDAKAQDGKYIYLTLPYFLGAIFIRSKTNTVNPNFKRALNAKIFNSCNKV